MQFTISSVTKLAALTVLAASTSAAFAQSAGDTIVSAGWANIAPQDSSTPLQITGPAPLARTLTGTGASVDKTNTLGFAVSRFITDNWVASLDLGVPPTYKLYGTGSLSSVGQIGEAKQLAPALLGKYYFGDAHTAFRPYVGLGVTRVSYTGVSLTSNFQNTVAGTLGLLSGGQVVAGGTSANLESSWGSVFNVGASYAINKDWYAGLSVSYVRLKTTADLTTSSNIGNVTSTTTLTLNPIVTYLSVGYRF